jgi:beta-glucosidase
MTPTYLTAPDGTRFRDLNGNGVMDPYEDPRLSADERAADLVARMSLEEKCGLMFQTVIEVGRTASCWRRRAHLEVADDHGRAGQAPVALQRARHPLRPAGGGLEQQPPGPGRADPARGAVTVSTDPRHAFVENTGVGFAAGPFSQWPEGLGLAAIDDVETVRRFADVARQEYRAVGIRAALHPQIDLATEPRWGGRPDPRAGCRAGRRVHRRLSQGFQGDALGPDSVACTTKHFPGGGPQKDGEDALPYGREQVYPGGMFEYHLEPFREAIRRGTAAMMPYYGMPIGLERNGVPIERSASATTGRSSRTSSAASSASTGSSSPTGSWSTTTTSATRCCRRARGASRSCRRASACSRSWMPGPTSSAARSASTC